PIESFSAVWEPIDVQAQIWEAQKHDAWVAQRREELVPDSPWTIIDGLLNYRDQLYVPGGPLRGLILSQCHDNPVAGHFGLFKTLNLVSHTFWWPRAQHDVQAYVTYCIQYSQAKSATGAPPCLLQPLPRPKDPGGLFSMDFLMDLPPSSGFMTVFVVVDMLTKVAHFILCHGLQSARATCCMFIQQVFRLHGLSYRIMSDRESQFTARFWQGLMKMLDVKICLSSAHHPQTDSGTEKVIGIFEQYLRCYINQQ
ncbi:PEG10: Retrotransposon-derived protein PEG10, partial [Crotalus adamanteus]